MTNRDAFLSYREKTVDKPPHERVYFFHSHLYYDGDDENEVAKMKLLLEHINTAFSEDNHVEVHEMQERALGPHPRPHLEILFTRERFADVVSYLTFTLPPTVSALIHPLTFDQAGDHTTRAMWLGKQLSINPEILHKMDADAAARGLSEEEIIWKIRQPKSFKDPMDNVHKRASTR
ncbi:Uncharacterized 21.2 kDa protein [Coccomyxa sp. Obi]|nr:Uncharacterized 21.2 kDa protein [Coccomyxa sp. Obi]